MNVRPAMMRSPLPSALFDPVLKNPPINLIPAIDTRAHPDIDA